MGHPDLFCWKQKTEATGYGKELKKELFSPAVVTVAEGKVEIRRILLQRLGLELGRVLENWPVELRASGKVGKRGSNGYPAMHRSHSGTEMGCGFLGRRGGK